MVETTLLICDLSEGANTAEKLAKKRKQVSPLFLLPLPYLSLPPLPYPSSLKAIHALKKEFSQQQQHN